MPTALKVLCATLLLTLAPAVQADRSELLQDYEKILPALADSAFGAPVHVQARLQDDRHGAAVYGLVRHPYSGVRAALTTPRQWCRFLPLNQNVKACTWQRGRLSLYVGRKFYQPPEDATQIDARFTVDARTADYTRVVVRAPEGPFGTADYGIVVEAAPVADGTLIRLQWAYQSSWRSRFATDVYLATLGRDKVGFSVVGHDPSGAPRYIGGVEGTIERNAMRYYLALEAFLASGRLPEDQWLTACLDAWYTATERYARQLHELSREEYLSAKRREFAHQSALQAGLRETDLAHALP